MPPRRHRLHRLAIPVGRGPGHEIARAPNDRPTFGRIAEEHHTDFGGVNIRFGIRFGQRLLAEVPDRLVALMEALTLATNCPKVRISTKNQAISYI